MPEQQDAGDHQKDRDRRFTDKKVSKRNPPYFRIRRARQKNPALGMIDDYTEARDDAQQLDAGIPAPPHLNFWSVPARLV